MSPKIRVASVLVSSLAAVLLLSLPAAAQGTIGYYDVCTGQGEPYQATMITGAGYTAVQVINLSAGELAPLDVLYVENDFCDITSEYTPNLPAIDAAVQAGMALLIFDWDEISEALMPGPGASVNMGEDSATGCSDDATVVGSTLVTDGPFGVLDNTSLDGGTCTYHYAALTALPAGSTEIIRGVDGDPVMFSYPYGSGAVIYASMPLGYYLQGSGPNPPRDAFTDIFGPNSLAYGLDVAQALGTGIPMTGGAGAVLLVTLLAGAGILVLRRVL